MKQSPDGKKGKRFLKKLIYYSHARVANGTRKYLLSGACKKFVCMHFFAGASVKEIIFPC